MFGCSVLLVVTPWTAARQASLSFPVSWSLLKLMSIESVIPSNHLTLCHPIPLLPSIFPSIRVFSNDLALHIRWPKYWSYTVDFLQDWLVWSLCYPRDSCKSLLQHQNFKASVLWCSTFFMIQLSHPYTTTGKVIALTRWTFVGKVMSLLFSMLSRFPVAFLPRSKCLLILWLQSLSTMTLETKKIKSVTFSTFPPSICHKVMESDAMILVFWMLCFKPAFSLSSFTFIKRLFSFS